jgi:hypothetical protein
LNRISENVEQIEVAVALRELRSMFFHWHNTEVMNFVSWNNILFDSFRCDCP